MSLHSKKNTSQHELTTPRRSVLAALGAALLAPINALATISWKGTPRVMQGPMVGWVDETEIAIWVRLSGEFALAIEYWPESQPDALMMTERVVPSRTTDFTHVEVLKGLTSGARYGYRVLVEGRVDEYMARHGDLFTATAPRGDAGARISFAFGSCPRVQQRPIQPVWDAVYEKRPDLFFWLGDNIYADTTDPYVFAEVYRHQRNVASYRKVMQSTPNLAIWDDHDYGLNDHDKRNPIKELALKLFKRYWANPSYGLPDTPGVFFKYSYGGVDFFFLDVRYYRDVDEDEDGPGKTTLGATQLQWLKDELKASEAPFKFLISGVGWTDEKGVPSQSWASYKYERREIFDFIRDNEITGVVLLSGDTHVGEFNCLTESDNGGYDLYELVSSPLAQDPSVSWINYLPIPRIRQIYSRSSNFGWVQIDTTKADPEMRLNLCDERGYEVWSPVVLRASELVGRKKTCKQKMDKLSLQRYERSQAGGTYYDKQTPGDSR